MSKLKDRRSRSEIAWQELSVDEQENLVATLARERTYLKVINTFALDLIAIPSKEKLAWYLAREVVAKLGFLDCVVYFYDPENKLLRRHAAIGRTKNPASDNSKNGLDIPFGEGISGHVAKTKKALVVDDLEKDGRYQADAESARSEICVPLLIDGEIVGVIDCEDRRVGHFKDFHLEILTTVAAMTSAKLKLIEQSLTVEVAKKLAVSEEQFRSLFQQSPIGFGVEDLSGVKRMVDGLRAKGFTDLHEYFSAHPDALYEAVSMARTIDANEVLIKMYGTSTLEEFIESEEDVHSWWGTEGMADYYANEISSLAEKGASYSAEIIDIKTDGTLITARCDSRVMAGYEDSWARVITTYEDVTERKAAAEKLRLSQERYRSIFDTAQAGISITDVNGTYQQCNEAWAAMLGYTQDEFLALTNMQVTDPADLQETKEKFRQLMAGDIQMYRLDKRYKRKDGGIFWGDLTVNPIRNHAGDIVGTMGVCIDITERNKTHQHLVDLSAAIDAMSEPVVVFDENDNFIFTNEAYRQLNAPIIDSIQLGGSFENHIKSIVEQGLTPDSFGREEEWITQRMERHQKPAGHFELKRQDGAWFLGTEKKLPSGGQVLLLTDISEIKKTQDELIRAKEEAERANQAKSDFLSSMSHELRTPMNAIMGFTQMLEFNPKEPLSKTQKASVACILKGGNHLLELIDQVLELNKIEAGKLTINMVHTRARDVIDECLSLTRSKAENEGIEIINRTAGEDLPMLLTDGTRLTQILLNLMSNAIKYNRKNGTLTLSGHEIPGRLYRLGVADTGEGIPRDKQEDLFKPFERLGRETGEVEGTGIGLTITKQIVDLLGGKVGYESEVGIGSTFWVDIPLSDKQPDVAKKVDTATEEIPKTEYRNKEGCVRKVLYVEDNPDNMRLMERIIGFVENTKLLTAPNAELGIDLAISERPALILMDINLPGMNGYEALKKLKSTKETKDIPVIAITAAAMAKDVVAGKKAGFRDYITKPIHVPGLIRTLEETLGRIDSAA